VLDLVRDAGSRLLVEPSRHKVGALGAVPVNAYQLDGTTVIINQHRVSAAGLSFCV
jgi:hypothetical protein